MKSRETVIDILPNLGLPFKHRSNLGYRLLSSFLYECLSYMLENVNPQARVCPV